jgi:FMN phosphatase YigB (HAD superfamily)
MSTQNTQLSATSPFYIVDFDRTLADSDKLLDVFITVANQFLEIPQEQVEAADRDIKAKGDSFDTASYVRDKLSEKGELVRWGELEKQFIHESRALNMLLPGASELLTQLSARQLRYGILTYGNPLWQHLKLTAAGFNHVHRIVTVNKHKGKLISSWQQDDGIFKLPHEFGGGSANNVVLIDDKAVSFNSFPDSPSKGIHVVDYERILPSQEGSVPSNVTHVSSLREALLVLF